MKLTKFLMLVFVLAAVSCAEEKQVEEAGSAGLDLSNMDQSVKPTEDFYRFANGGWLDNTQLPDDEGRWTGFNELRDQTNVVLLGLLNESAEAGFEDGSDEQKAIDFYTIGMDSTLAENVGTKPIMKWFDKIDSYQSDEELIELLADLHRNGYSSFFGAQVMGDLMNSEINAFYMAADALGLPNKDYYTKEDAKSVELRTKYVEHIARMLTLGEIEADAQAIFDLEMEMAQVSKSPIEMRNIPALYNLRSRDQLMAEAPGFDWNAYLSAIGVEGVDTLIVTEPVFMARFAELLSETDASTLKSYMKWNVIRRASSYLNHEMVRANFDFYGKELAGTDQMKPRWERVMGTTNGVIGEAMGKVYVSEAFPPEAKAAAQEMVNNLLLAFEKRINGLPWMSDETKERALEKLSTFTVKIGYPDEWKDYSGLVVEKSGESFSYMDNLENASQFQYKEMMEKNGKPVDRKEWGMSPQTVNAYYNPLNNEIVFPAGILQPPFYNYKADPAVNYGGIGAVIGHEISHGFDDNGSRFDADGNMVNWWTDTDKEQFEERTGLLIKQYDSYEALDSVFVQGQLTLGENIGDLGGLNAAYEGMQIHFEKNGKPDPIDGFTQEQRFFLSWATIWRSMYRDETLRTQILTDPHSPGMYRAVGPLTNMEQFYEAFDVKEGDPMWKPDSLRVKIW